jgi:RNA polymerase sigma factor (sigma-70 family)
MATAELSRFLRSLTRGMAAEALASRSDRQLVEQFLATRDEAVFEALLRRHGPMVYRVCWRALQRSQDTEDAFQATFLLLAQKLRTVRNRDSLASWLHGVAHRVALKAKAQASTRRRHDRLGAVSEAVPPDKLTWRELRTVLDAELACLPERLRLPLILCYLEGCTQEEAAGRLSWSKSTLIRRLDEARAALGRRLTRQGVVWPAALSGVLLSDCVASAVLRPGLIGSTVEAASFVAAGQAVTAGAISAQVAALTEGVLKTMLLNKLKVTVAALVILGVLGIGAGALPRRTEAAQSPSGASKSLVARQDEGNLKETVLALEKRIWEAHVRQDLDVFKNLLAEDYVGLDLHRRPFTKAGVLDYVSKFRVIEPAMKEPRVIVLSPTSAVVAYEIHYKTCPTDGKNVESTRRHVTTAWARRDGKWWAVFTEDTLVQKDGTFLNVVGFDREGGTLSRWEMPREKKPIEFKEEIGRSNTLPLSVPKVEFKPDQGGPGLPITAKEIVIHEAKHRINLSFIKLAQSKDEKAEQDAVAAIEKDVKGLRDLLMLIRKSGK